MHTSHLIEPQIDILNRELAGVRWPTYGAFALAGLVWGAALVLPFGWGAVQWAMLVFALTLHSSLSHEILHGGFFRSTRANGWLGAFQPGLFVPYLRFRAGRTGPAANPRKPRARWRRPRSHARRASGCRCR